MLSCDGACNKLLSALNNHRSFEQWPLLWLVVRCLNEVCYRHTPQVSNPHSGSAAVPSVTRSPRAARAAGSRVCRAGWHPCGDTALEMWGCPLASNAFPLERGNSCQWSRRAGTQLGTEGVIALLQLLPYLWLEQKDSPLLLVCVHVDVGQYNQPNPGIFRKECFWAFTLSSHPAIMTQDM